MIANNTAIIITVLINHRSNLFSIPNLVARGVYVQAGGRMKIAVAARTVAWADRLHLKAAPKIQMIANHNSLDSASREFLP
jgi:hypothetical protein